MPGSARFQGEASEEARLISARRFLANFRPVLESSVNHIARQFVQVGIRGEWSQTPEFVHIVWIGLLMFRQRR